LKGEDTDTCTLQDVFAAGFEEYAARRELHPRELNAARCISQCYTAALGMHVQYCEQGDYEQLQYHACRHRSCPKCGAYSRQAWIDAQMRRLLPCAHFHVIFTIPHSLLQLWEHNRRWFIGALFDAARSSLLELSADPRHLGALPGLTMALHTWGRDLSRHPHLHCLVTAGGVDEQGQWKACSKGQLVPFKPLHNLFRGKLLSTVRQALRNGHLVLPAWLSAADAHKQLRALYGKRWNVRIEQQYEHGAGLTLYLARYAKGGPLPQERQLRMHDGQVLMPYSDHRDNKSKTLRLRTGGCLNFCVQGHGDLSTAAGGRRLRRTGRPTRWTSRGSSRHWPREPIAVGDRKLVHRLAPFAYGSMAPLADVTQCQPDQFGRRLVAGEVPARLDDLA
jgi:hypothetical protein